MEFYWSWCIVAFFLQVTGLIISLTYIFSIRAKNLKQVWLYFSIGHRTFIEQKKPWAFWILFSILFSLFIEPLFSWLSVIFSIYSYIKIISNIISTPEKIKEIKFKLWIRLLNKEEVKILLKELSEFQGIKEDLSIQWEDFEEDNTLILEDKDGWYTEIDIYDKKNNKFAIYSHTPEYTSTYDICEYKIEWNSIYDRTLEKRINNPWEEYYDVKDWVILESEIIERCKKSLLLNSEELVNNLKNEILWNEIKSIEIKYFILSKSPEKISVQDFKTILRTELERIKLLLSKFKALCIKYNVEFEYDEMDSIIFVSNKSGTWKKDNKSDSKIKKFLKELELLENNNNCNRGEIFNSSNRIKLINKYIENLK